MRVLKQSTAYSLTVLMTDASDHVSGKTGLTLTIAASKAGGSFGSITPTVTELANGWYKLALTTSHSDTVGDLALHITSTGADPCDVVMQVREQVLGDTLTANVTQFGGSNGTFASGRPEVNASHVAGSTVSTSAAQIGVNVVNAGGTAWATVVTNLVSSIWSAVTDSSGVTTLLSRLSSARAGYLDNLSAGAVATASALTSVAGDVTTLLGRITSSLFSGITSLAQWLGSMAGKQTANSTARTEIRATGAGSGTFDETTDSQEALRDRGDAAWTTATGFSTLDAAGVRTAVGLTTANLDAQFSGIAGDAGDAKTAAEAVKIVTDKLDDTLEDNAGTYRFTDDALAEAPTGGGGGGPTASQIADAVWDEDLSGHTTTGTAGNTLGNVATGTPPSAAAIADAVWDEATSGHGSAGTFGKAAADTLADAAAILDDTGTSGVVVAAGSKTGFALTSAYDAAKTAAQAGDKMDLVDAPNATAIAALQAGLSTLDAAGVRTELSTELGRIDAAVSTRATPAQVNTEADQALADVGLTVAVTGRIDTTVSSRLAGASYTAPPSAASIRSEIDSNSTKLAAIDSKTSNLPSDPADQSAVEDAIDAAVAAFMAALAGLHDLSASDVKAQIVAALSADTYAEPSAVPAATAPLAAKLGWVFTLARNVIQQAATTQTVKKADGTTDLASATVSDDNGVFERAAWQ